MILLSKKKKNIFGPSVTDMVCFILECTEFINCSGYFGLKFAVPIVLLGVNFAIKN